MRQIQIDANKLKWKDIIFIDEFDGDATGNIRRITEMLARLVVDLDMDEIVELELDDIRYIFSQIEEAGQELIPPQTESGSPIS